MNSTRLEWAGLSRKWPLNNAEAAAVCYAGGVLVMLALLAILSWRQRASMYVFRSFGACRCAKLTPSHTKRPAQLRHPHWHLAGLAAGAVWIAGGAIARCTPHGASGFGCVFWGLWIEYVAGAAAWAACVLVALDAAHCIFNGVLVHAQTRRRRLVTAAAAVAPAAVIATVVTALQAGTSVSALACAVPAAARAALVAAFAANYAWGGVLVALTRRARPHFSEYRALMVAALLSGVFAIPIVAVQLLDDARRHSAAASVLVSVCETTLVLVYSLAATWPMLTTKVSIHERLLDLDTNAAVLSTLGGVLEHPFARFSFIEHTRAHGTPVAAHAADAFMRIQWWRALGARERAAAALATVEELGRLLSGANEALADAWARIDADAHDEAALDGVARVVESRLVAHFDVYKNSEARAFYEAQTSARDENGALRASMPAFGGA